MDRKEAIDALRSLIGNKKISVLAKKLGPAQTTFGGCIDILDGVSPAEISESLLAATDGPAANSSRIAFVAGNGSAEAIAFSAEEWVGAFYDPKRKAFRLSGWSLGENGAPKERLEAEAVFFGQNSEPLSIEAILGRPEKEQEAEREKGLLDSSRLLNLLKFTKISSPRQSA